MLVPTDDPDQGVYSTHIHADGRYAEKLWVETPASIYDPLITHEHLDQGLTRPSMQGRDVFKHAVVRMPQAVNEALEANGFSIDDVDMVIPHQANLRISQAVQKILGLPDDRVYNNIQRYGNTTAATIPIMLAEAQGEGRLERGMKIAAVAFGSGFTWGAAIIDW